MTKIRETADVKRVAKNVSYEEEAVKGDRITEKPGDGITASDSPSWIHLRIRPSSFMIFTAFLFQVPGSENEWRSLNAAKRGHGKLRRQLTGERESIFSPVLLLQSPGFTLENSFDNATKQHEGKKEERIYCSPFHALTSLNTMNTIIPWKSRAASLLSQYCVMHST